MRSNPLRTLSFWVVCLLVTGAARAFEKPTLNHLFPPSGQVATSVEVLATGKFSKWPVEVWASDPSIRWECQSESGKLLATIDPNAPVGVHWLRLWNSEGASGTLPFLVGTHPQKNETEPNNIVSQANALEAVPCSINGVLAKRGDVDLFSIQLEAGQMIAVNVDSAKWLFSPADVSLQILDAKGFVLAENLDHVGLDPYVEYHAMERTMIVVKVFAFPAAPDSNIGFGGGADWSYRMLLSPASKPFGSILDFEKQSLLDAEKLELPHSSHSSAETALPVSLPATFAGTIAELQQQQVVSFDGKSGVHYRIETLAREFGSDLDPVITLYNAQQQELVKMDDVAEVRDPVVNWICPADGKYFVAIRDFHRLGGNQYRHITSIKVVEPGYRLSTETETLELKVKQEVELPIQLIREAGFAGEVSVELEASSEFVEVIAAVSKSGSETANKVVLKWTGTKPFQGPLKIIGRSEGQPTTAAIPPRSRVLWVSVVE